MNIRPCSFTEEENEKKWRTSIFWTESNFYKEYKKHAAAMEHIAEAAKIFIIKNHKSIKDWGSLDVRIIDNTGKETHYYKFEDDDRWNTDLKAVRQMLQRRKDKQKPIVSLTDVVLDTTDGDFSLKINGKDHLWIDNDSIIEIADFIEQVLNSDKNDERSATQQELNSSNVD